jgi:DNA helicase HerA-like ATPase
MNSRQTSLDRFAIAPRSRTLILGQTGSGKSTLAGVLLKEWVSKGRRLVIFDTKPRWKADYLPNGMSAMYRYRGWTLGEIFPESISVTTWDEWVEARRRLDDRTIIVQTLIGERPDLDLQAEIAVDLFRRAGRQKRPVLFYLDETMDHFHPSTAPIASDDGWIWAQVCRAGRELGVAAMFATQRPRSIPMAMLEEMSQMFLFAISDQNDLKRLWEIGFPRGQTSPDELHQFYLWRKDRKSRVYGPFMLSLV